MRPALAQVIGVGMACPVGLHSRAALAAMHAGVVRFVEVDDLVGPGGPVRASRLATLDHAATRTERATALARRAVQEALSGHEEALAARRLPCFLALPEPGFGAPIARDPITDVLAEVATDSGVRLQFERIAAAGRAGAFEALAAALTLLARGEEMFALVAGVDSLVDAQTLAELADSDRLLGRTNLDGVIPGEGAACVLLGRPGAAARGRVLAQVVAAAVGREPQPFLLAGDRIGAGEGLSAVFRRLRADVDGRVDQVFAGTSGQLHFGREFSHAYLRNEALMPEPLQCEPLSHALGDVGAAAGAICMVQAVGRLSLQLTGLAYASSDSGLVGGCVLARAE